VLKKPLPEWVALAAAFALAFAVASCVFSLAMTGRPAGSVRAIGTMVAGDVAALLLVLAVYAPARRAVLRSLRRDA
jgi:hypothetical protein